MPRIITSQPAISRPTMIAFDDLSDDWLTIAEAPDYSVPDPTVRWPNERDPEDPNRRIQPGQLLFTTPLYVHNTAPEQRLIEFRVLYHRTDALVRQARVILPGYETYIHPVSGFTLIKDDPEKSFGDRLQVRLADPDGVEVTGTAVIGAAEQDQPA